MRMAINGNKYVNAETNSYEGHHSPRTRNWKAKPPEPLEPWPLHLVPPLTLYHKVVFNSKIGNVFRPQGNEASGACRSRSRSDDQKTSIAAQNDAAGSCRCERAGYAIYRQ